MATPSLAGRLARLPTMTAAQLRAEYAAIYGETTRSGNKAWLAKRVAWRMQRLAHGGLSPAALAKADELADGADLRLNPPPGHDPAAAPTPASAHRRCVHEPEATRSDVRSPHGHPRSSRPHCASSCSTSRPQTWILRG